ncbi:MAG: NHL repeat-containing protein [Solirubrobacteraceae bacterium]|nr:NHL repeat-containing protein [Solirubrobacteraceae bacterium]
MITESAPHVGIVTGAGAGAGAGPVPATYGPWRPRTILGARSSGGLLLPDAKPTASALYAPRGVWLDDERLIASDTGNHRVLIWHGRPDRDGAPADVVLGQPDANSEGPAAGGAGPGNGMFLPTGVLVDDGRLVVSDAWHHRILVWDRVPQRTGTAPDHVLGQPGPHAVEPNAGADATATTFYWPFGVAVVDGRFYVCDTGNRRILAWSDGIPLDGRGADVVLGQPDARSRSENRGGAVGPDSFRWPHAIAGTGDGGIVVADAGNHRLLRWDAHPRADRPADGVLGQPDLHTAVEFPYVSQEGRLRFPYAVASGPGLAVADTANNRVLLWDEVPTAATAPAAVLAQPDLAAAGENRWERIAADTLCWPYGLARWGDELAIADSGNNRIVLWDAAAAGGR